MELPIRVQLSGNKLSWVKNWPPLSEQSTDLLGAEVWTRVVTWQQPPPLILIIGTLHIVFCLQYLAIPGSTLHLHLLFCSQYSPHWTSAGSICQRHFQRLVLPRLIVLCMLSSDRMTGVEGGEYKLNIWNCCLMLSPLYNSYQRVSPV